MVTTLRPARRDRTGTTRLVPQCHDEIMSDPGTRLMRYRLVETLVEVASPAEDQVALLDRGGFPVAELARSFSDWFDRVGTLQDRGALSPEVVTALDSVDAAFRVIDEASSGDPGSPYLWTNESLRGDPEWEEVRRAARTALRAFSDLGIPIPKLTDPDFNIGRDDAP
jgi:hypothetical protein